MQTTEVVEESIEMMAAALGAFKVVSHWFILLCYRGALYQVQVDQRAYIFKHFPYNHVPEHAVALTLHRNPKPAS